jgi:hypothetical protein
MEDYKGYFISGSAVPTYLTGQQSRSLGIVLKSGRLGSVIEVKRIEGPTFDGKQEAEQHGLELCKAWPLILLPAMALLKFD